MSGLKKRIYFTNNLMISMSYGSFLLVRTSQTVVTPAVTHLFYFVALAPVASTFLKKTATVTPDKTLSSSLTRFAIQAKGPDGKWTRKPLAYRESNNVHLLITRPHEICVYLIFKHIHATSSYTICRQFVPFIYCPLRTSAS